ncbi:MAG: archaellin/type IV pilin N-terminal domain-containing protein, partial [Nitrososphaerales archaeon]
MKIKSRHLSRVRKRGVSEIIATVLMVLLVVSISATVFAYASNGLGSFGESFSNLLANQGNAISEQFSLEQSTFNLTAGLPPYIQMTITNSQNSPTPAPFQQELTINPSLYTSLESSDLGNIRFYSTLSGGAFSGPIDSWLESTSSSPANTASSATFWIDLTTGIAASSSAAVYMVFETTTPEFDGNVAGEAPQLSASYGLYDNGANVFNQYGGASWTSFTFQSGTWSTANGYLQQTGTTAIGGTAGGPAALIESTQYSVSSSYVLEMAFGYTTRATARVGIIADG